MSKYGVFTGRYFPVFGLNTGKYGPQKNSIFGTVQALFNSVDVAQGIPGTWLSSYMKGHVE